jgi:hypothetical protein
LLAYYFTSSVALAGLIFGHQLLQLPDHPLAKRSDLLRSFANWDGGWYVKIVHAGYHYQPHQASDVAFFPAYPLTAAVVVHSTGCRIDLALLIVSHACLAAVFVLLAAYLRSRYPDRSAAVTGSVLFAFGLWPTSCFGRFAYSESMFLLTAVLAFYAMERRWPLVVTALIIGLATATRPVGVALVIPFAMHLWDRTRQLSSDSPGLGIEWKRMLLAFSYLPLACWGIIAYMIFLWATFGAPFAFAQTQENWRVRPAGTIGEKALALATLEPIWSVFVPSYPGYWGRFTPEPSALFSLHLANPIYFVLAVGLTVLGAGKRWLTGKETAFALSLLAIVYLTRSYEMCMLGTGRFTVTAFPIFLVLGRLLHRVPAPLAAALLSISGFFLAVYSALFAAWYRVF